MINIIISKFSCKICNEILYSPSLTKCCGETACYNCFNINKSFKNICPFCNLKNLKIMPNFKLQQMKEMIAKKYNINELLSNNNTSSIINYNTSKSSIDIITQNNFYNNSYTTKFNFYHIFTNSKFFIMKSHNIDNIKLSQESNLWATSKMNSYKLNEAFKNNFVVLIFSANKSRSFQGFAIMKSFINKYEINPPNWIVDNNFKLGDSFKINWLVNCEFPFDKIRSFKNRLNSDEPIVNSRDTQEIPNEIGSSLCVKLYETRKNDKNFNLEEVIEKINKSQNEYNKEYVSRKRKRSKNYS